MGRLSQLAKSAGYLVAMAPAESYLDPTTHLFDLTLTHTYPEWEALQPDFRYHGHNTYAYLLARYGTTTLPLLSPLVEALPDQGRRGAEGVTDAAAGTVETAVGVTGGLAESVAQGVSQGLTGTEVLAEVEGAAEVVATFDFVTVQLYEGYSHAQYQSYVLGRPAGQVVAEWVKVRGRWRTR